MSLKLYFHPLASFCQKVLVALCENDTPFEPVFVDLGEPQARAAFLKVWPIGRFPVLRDADCAAAPALFYANMVLPFGSNHPSTTAYLARLQARPSVRRVQREAEPYLNLVPR